jgi:hypothetical protein
MGAVFQMPTVVFFLAKTGLITAGLLWPNFRYAFLLIFIVAAVITPTGDMITQTIFEVLPISATLSGATRRRRGARQQRQNLFPIRFPPPGAEVCDVRQLAVGARCAAGEIPERRARKDDIRLNTARPRPLLAPGVQAVVPITHVVGLAIGLRRALGWGVESLLDGV